MTEITQAERRFEMVNEALTKTYRAGFKEAQEAAAKVVRDYIDPIEATEHENRCFNGIAFRIANLSPSTTGGFTNG